MNNCLELKTQNKTGVDLDQQLFDHSKSWTLSMWISIHDFTTDEDISIISQTNGYSLRYTVAVRSDHCIYSWSGAYGYDKIDSGLKEDTPFHLCIVNDKGTYKFYINGELKFQKFYTIDNANTTLGYYANYQYITASIDEFKIYKSILTEAEIKASMNSNGEDPNLFLMYFNFDTVKDIDGEKYIIDLSSNHKDLLVKNFYKLEKSFIHFYKFQIKKENKYYNLDLEEVDNKYYFNSVNQLFTKNKNQLTPINELDTFNLLILKEN